MGQFVAENVEVEPNFAENPAQEPSGANATADGEVEELGSIPKLANEGRVVSLLGFGRPAERE